MREFIENHLWKGFLANSIEKRRLSGKITINDIRESVTNALGIGNFPVTDWV